MDENTDQYPDDERYAPRPVEGPYDDQAGIEEHPGPL
jgi:hypothetical protein